MAGKVYTNADAERQYGRNIPDQYGPWRDVPSASDGIDSAVGEPNIDQVIANAKAALAGSSRLGAQAEMMPSHGPEQRPMPRGLDIADTIGQGASLAMIPASFLGGPVGAVAGGALALEGIGNAIHDPSMGNVAMAGLGVLPGLNMARRAMGFGKAASKAGPAILHGAEMFADAGQGATGGTRAARVAYNTAEDAGGVPGLERYMPNTSTEPTSVSGIEQAVEQAPTHITNNASGESAASQEALNRLTSMKAQNKQFGVFDRAGKFRPLIGPDAVDHIPAKGETYGVMTPNGFQVLSDNGGRVVHPMGAAGDEYSGVKQAITEATKRGEKGGAFNRNLTQLTPEEATAAPEFMDNELQALIKGLLHAR